LRISPTLSEKTVTSQPEIYGEPAEPSTIFLILNSYFLILNSAVQLHFRDPNSIAATLGNPEPAKISLKN